MCVCVCDVFAALEDDEGKNNDGISFSSSTGPAWADSERDYTYDEVGQYRHTQDSAINRQPTDFRATLYLVFTSDVVHQ